MASKEEIMEITKKLKEHERRLSKLETIFKTEPEVVAKKISIKEFILSKKPKGDTQKTLCIGYYLEKHEGLGSFNVKDLKDAFRQAKEPLPSNINQMVNDNIKKDHVMEAGEKKDNLKAWVLTNSGEKYVEENFEKEK